MDLSAKDPIYVTPIIMGATMFIQQKMTPTAVGDPAQANGGWVLSPMVGAGTINQGNFSLPSLAVSFLGAMILLAVVGLIRRGALR